MGQPEFKEEIKIIHGNKWKYKHNGPKPLECSKNGYKKEVYNRGLPQEGRKISNTHPSFTPKETKKWTANEA